MRTLRKEAKVICPSCGTKIAAKHYDPEYEWYECPKCEGCYTPQELESERSKRFVTRTAAKKTRAGRDRRVRSGVIAKGKKRQTEIEEDEEALAKFEQESLKPRKTKNVVHHRDEIETSQVLNILADEIEAIGEEIGVEINRLNAREFYAMNLWRPLKLAGISAREKSVPMRKCKAHA